MNCAFCKFAEPYVDVKAEFVVNGVSVCEDHVDYSSSDEFGRDLFRLQQDIKLRKKG